MKRLCAVLAMVKDEEVFMPFWVKHYSKWFSPTDFYIHSDGTADNTLNLLPRGTNIIEVKDCDIPSVPPWPGKANDVYIKRVISNLLEDYECVLFAESPDDIIVPSPAHDCDLLKYVEKFVDSDRNYEHLTCVNVTHDLASNEAAYDVSKGTLLSQRTKMIRANQYDNAFLWKEIPWWQNGWHNLGPRVNNGKRLCGRGDGSLYNLHIHYADYDLCNIRHTQRCNVFNETQLKCYVHWTNQQLKNVMCEMISNPGKWFSEGAVLDLESWMKDVV